MLSYPMLPSGTDPRGCEEMQQLYVRAHRAHSSSYGARCPETLNDRTERLAWRLELSLGVVSRASCYFVTDGCIGSSSLIPLEVNT